MKGTFTITLFLCVWMFCVRVCVRVTCRPDSFRGQHEGLGSPGTRLSTLVWVLGLSPTWATNALLSHLSSPKSHLLNPFYNEGVIFFLTALWAFRSGVCAFIPLLFLLCFFCFIFAWWWGSKPDLVWVDNPALPSLSSEVELGFLPLGRYVKASSPDLR